MKFSDGPKLSRNSSVIEDDLPQSPLTAALLGPNVHRYFGIKEVSFIMGHGYSEWTLRNKLAALSNGNPRKYPEHVLAALPPMEKGPGGWRIWSQTFWKWRMRQERLSERY